MTTDRLRVLIVANMYPSPSRPSYGVFVADQVAALRATGEVEVEVFHWDARRRPWRYALAALELALTRLDVDLVHAHYGLSGVVALAAPRRLPLVLTVHGRDCHHPAVKRLTALVARRAAAVVAVSDELARQCPFPVAAVIPPGVDLELFRPLPRPRRALAWASRSATPVDWSSFPPTRGVPKSALPTRVRSLSTSGPGRRWSCGRSSGARAPRCRCG